MTIEKMKHQKVAGDESKSSQIVNFWIKGSSVFYYFHCCSIFESSAA